MIRTIEVEIDDTGRIHPTKPTDALPIGRALLTWRSNPDITCTLLSEASLAGNWLTPEEDEAWAYLQPVK